MIHDDQKEKTDCQLQVVYESGEKPTMVDRIRHILLRFLSAVSRRIQGNQRNSNPFPVGGPGVGVDESLLNEKIQDAQESGGERILFNPGEIVRLKTLEEIQKTLDSSGRCEGLQFMLGMKKYCGREARVLKKVRLMFDERLWRMVKLRNTYILENITCDGRDVFDGEGCDRTCYFFWKEKWLRKGR
jgi:hypothetical protein